MRVAPRHRGHYDGVEYEAFAARYLKSILRRADLFVDVGAHYGFFTLLAASANDKLTIIAAEPVAETRAFLLQNISAMDARRISVCADAISDTCESKPFRISGSDDCSPHPNAQPIGQAAVDTTSIDALLEDFDACRLVVRIDAAGHELAVLRGMRDTLLRFSDVILVVELNPERQKAAGFAPERLLQQLDSLGFALFVVDRQQELSYRIEASEDLTRFIGEESCANLICLRKEKALSLVFFAHSALLNGAERSLLGLVKDVVAHQGSLCTVVLPANGPLEPRLKDAGAGVIVAPSAWWCGPDGMTPEMLAEGLAVSAPAQVTDLLPRLREIDPDVIVTQTLVIPWGANAAALLNKPHIWSVCEFGELDHGLRFVEPFANIVADIEACSDFVFCCTNGVRNEFFSKLTPAACDVLYRHIELPPIEGSAHRRSGGDRVVRLGFFGTLSPMKGQADAIAAAAELKARGLSIDLTLVGTGHLDHVFKLARLIQDYGLEQSVHLAGFIEDPYPAMRNCDIVLVCSQREAFGRAAAEAMLMAKPVIYSASGCVAEYLQDGETGLSYPPGDIAALADRIARLAGDRAFRERLGQAAQNFALATFCHENYGGKFFAKALALRGLRRAQPQPGSLQRALHAASVATRDQIEPTQARAVQGAPAPNSSVSQCPRIDTQIAGGNAKIAQVSGCDAAMKRSDTQQRFRGFWKAGAKPVLPARAARETSDVIRNSVFFNAEFYLDANPDVKAAGFDPALHYFLHGASEGRNPGPFFSTKDYLEQNPEVAALGLNPLLHYELHGRS